MDYKEKLAIEKIQFLTSLEEIEDKKFVSKVIESYVEIDNICQGLISVLDLLDEIEIDEEKKKMIRKLVLDSRNQIPRKYRELFMK